MNTNYQKAFTIVELLVVIVVIGILASITIISFSGISQRAISASLQSDLGNASKILKMDLAENGSFPSSPEEANGNKGIPYSDGTSYQYTANNSTSTKEFCITATKSNMSYYLNQDSEPAIGGCPGDIVLGSPTIANPSFELDAVGNLSYPTEWNQYGMIGNVYEGVTDDFSMYGTKSFKISQQVDYMDGGIWGRISGLTIGQRVSVSVWIKSGPDIETATFVLCNNQHDLTGDTYVENNQGANVNGRFTSTVDSIDTTDLDIFLGQGSFTGASYGDVWFDGLQITVD